MSFKSLCLAAAVFLIGIQSASAQSSSFTTKTTGTATSGIKVPGVLELPAGAPYEMELTSTFVPDPSMFMIPDTLEAYGADVQAIIRVNGTEYAFSGPGYVSIYWQEMMPSTQRFISFNQTVVLPVLDGDGFIQMSNLMHGPDSQVQVDSLQDVFATSGGSYQGVQDGNAIITVFHYRDGKLGQAFNPPQTFEFGTTGSIMVPVPEPSSYAMMIAGLVLLSTLARRRRSQVYMR